MSFLPIIAIPLLVVAIVGLTIFILHKAQPADFKSKSSAAGRGSKDVIVEQFGDFRAEDEPQIDAESKAWRVSYKGMLGDVELMAAKAPSVREAVRALSRLRRSRDRRVVYAARLAGDHSYIVCKHGSGRLVGWTNAEWVFVATGPEWMALSEFVKAYPY
ncbi:MAG: hypothetical protein JXJ17_16650 [Anaerolineae bacterium]|nr:hypothetical protein [Anaerolineae bacterium]